MSHLLPCLVLTLVCCQGIAVAADEMVSVTGTVRDEMGRPVAGVEVSSMWSANGTQRRPDGTPFDLSKESELHQFWGRIGQMHPMKRKIGVTDDEGRFQFDVRVTHHALIAMDPKREQGGIAILPSSAGPLEIEIQLKPLVRVAGRFYVPAQGNTPTWTHFYILVPPKDNWPLSSGRVAHGGSMENRFEVALPPGTYQIWAYGQSPGSEEIDLVADGLIDFVVPEGRERVDIGTISLTPDSPDAREIARRGDNWNETESLIGKVAPDWHIDFACGLDPNARLADFRGRWVLLYFWHRSCVPCVTREIPQLIKLSKTQDHGDIRFEIVTFYLGWWGEELRSIDQLNRELKPLEKHVWRLERPLPLPVAVDQTGRTYARYGADLSGVSVLINPQGVVVPGGLEKLKSLMISELSPLEAPKPIVKNGG